MIPKLMNYFQQMLTKSLSVLKKYSLHLLVFYAVILTLGSLVNTGGLPNLGSDFDDKIYHSFAYLVFSILAYNYFRNRQNKHRIVFAGSIVFVYGIIIEILQYTLTHNRTFDLNDILANSIGVLLGILAIGLVKR